MKEFRIFVSNKTGELARVAGQFGNEGQDPPIVMPHVERTI